VELKDDAEAKENPGGDLVKNSVSLGELGGEGESLFRRGKLA